MTSPLDTEVRELLDSRRGTWQQVAEDCGVSVSWISKFVRSEIVNPRYHTLVKLREYLKPKRRAGKKESATG
jgi:transcriptional regulator with XRE-family HTH domain